ncbi:MAG: Fe-S metabolism protein SufE [Bacteroidetes bacterium]|nr:MAG: Fe-S metabolism protein SufE [Bacteroidota bacterium]
MGNTKLLEKRQEEVVEEFSMFGDWMEKYEHIIEIGKELLPMDEKDKVEENLIKGCQSRVWLTAKLNSQGEVIFSADSDAIITKGMVALMVRVLSGATPTEIAQVKLHFLDEIGFHQHLSPTRSNGLASMVKQMKMYGLVYSSRS